MNFPRVAIIVLHYHNLADTRACLTSLRGLDYPDLRIIVVNNDKLEHGKILQDEFAGLAAFIQNETNLGFAEGNNVGIRAALADQPTDAVLLLNNDTEVEPNFLREMVKIKADMAAPRMMQLENRNKVDNLGLVLMQSGLPFNRRSESQKLFCPSGGAALYSRRLLETVAFEKNGEKYYLDPDYFCYCEDLDIGWRARLLGLPAGYADAAVVYHRGSAASGQLSDLAVYHTYRNLLWTQFKNLPFILLLWQSPWLAAGWIWLLAFYSLKGRPLLIVGSLADGWLGLSSQIRRHRLIQSSKKISNRAMLSFFSRGLFPKNYL